MGTHDLDKFASDSPITHEAVAPKDIVFQALEQTQSMNAEKLFEIFKEDMKMRKFLPNLDCHEKHPVYYNKIVGSFLFPQSFTLRPQISVFTLKMSLLKLQAQI